MCAPKYGLPTHVVQVRLRVEGLRTGRTATTLPLQIFQMYVGIATRMFARL